MQISVNSFCKPNPFCLRRHSLAHKPTISNEKLQKINDQLESVNKSLISNPELISSLVPIELLSEMILQSFEYSLPDLLTGSREPQFVVPRMYLGAFLHLKYGYNLIEIGYMQGFSHSNIIHHCRTFFSDCNGPEFLTEAVKVESRLNLQLPGFGNLVLPYSQLKSKYHAYRIR